MERLIRYNFFIDLERIQYKPSSDYSLNIFFSHPLSYIDGPEFSSLKPLQNVHSWKFGDM